MEASALRQYNTLCGRNNLGEIIMKEFIKKYFPSYLIVPILVLIISNVVVYYGAKIVNELLGRSYIDMSGGLEFATPLVPAFVFIYVAAYPFWYITYYLLCRSSKELCYNIVVTDVIAKVFCGLLFILIPTTNVRPELPGTGASNILLNLIYTLDSPHNLFPSVHCLESWICFAYVNELKDCKPWLKAFTFLFSIAICLSTVFIRQHAWIDVFAGILIAEFFRKTVPYFYGALSELSLSRSLKRSV